MHLDLIFAGYRDRIFMVSMISSRSSVVVIIADGVAAARPMAVITPWSTPWLAVPSKLTRVPGPALGCLVIRRLLVLAIRMA